MQISIAERLHPFSHVPGTSCLIPYSSLSVQIFPTLLRFQDLASGETLEMTLSLRGPVKDFTVMTDLEKGRVTVFGQTLDGFVRYHIFVQEEKMILLVEKSPKSGFIYKIDKKEGKMEGSISLPISFLHSQKRSSERLSLGMHKSQDWQLVHRRQDLKEIFPHWVRLAEVSPVIDKVKEKKGMFALLRECERLIESREITELNFAFTNLFLAGFKGILVPRLQDEEFQGIIEQEGNPSCSTIALLGIGASLIRSLFFTESKKSISLLPCLPPEFHAGRFTGILCENGNVIDMEWSKKLLRRAIIRSYSDSTVSLDLQKPIKSFRLRRSLREKGVRMQADDSFSLEKGATVYIDCIQK